jgi:hypothetical protein
MPYKSSTIAEVRMMSVYKKPLMPDRVRTIDGGFSFIPHRFVTHHFFTSLSQHELLIYFLLVLVGDRQGLSYYSQDRLCIMLRLSLDEFVTARNGLIEKSLIAFDGFMFQVLSLPERPFDVTQKSLKTKEDFESSDPLTIRKLVTESLNQS